MYCSVHRDKEAMEQKVKHRALYFVDAPEDRSLLTKRILCNFAGVTVCRFIHHDQISLANAHPSYTDLLFGLHLCCDKPTANAFVRLL